MRWLYILLGTFLIFLGSTGAAVAGQALTHDYVIRWQSEPAAKVWQNPVVANDLVYLARQDGTLSAVDLESGREVWSANTGSAFPLGPAIADGVLFTANQNGPLHALDAVTGTILWTVDIVAGTDAPVAGSGRAFITHRGNDGAELIALDAGTGEIAWTAPLGESSKGPLVLLEDHVVAPGSIGESRVPTVLSFDASTGAEVWRSAPESPMALAGGRGKLIYAIGADGLIALEAATGEATWAFLPGQDEPGGVWAVDGPAVSQEVLFLGTAIGMGGNPNPSRSGMVYALDAASGEPIWQTEIDGGVANGPVVANDIVAVAGGLQHGLYVLDADSGEVAWFYPNRTGSVAELTAAEGWLVVADANGSVAAWEDLRN
jgi:outer membrane protein assembly factor BamB